MIISKRAVAEYLSRDFDSYLWMKRLQRRDLVEELARFKNPPQFKTDPWLHQLVCVYIGLCNPRFLYLLDMGLGKSKILMDLITNARARRDLKRALVTVPRLINIDSWLDDVARHSDLEPNPIALADIEAKRERLLCPTGELTLIDYQGLHWALCEKKKGQLVRVDRWVRMAQRLYNFLGIDESHKLSNHESLWFGIMRQLARHSDYVYACTGTLFGRQVEDIWSQFYLVDKGETFGSNLGLFRGSFFRTKTHPWKGVVYEYDKGMTRQLNKMLAHKSIRYDSDEIEEINLPKRMPPIVRRFDLSPEQREHYLKAVEAAINADSAEALDAPWIRMRQITSGYLKWKDEHGDHLIRFKQNPKLDDLERTLDEIGDRKIIIVYVYTDTGQLICDRLKALKIDYEWFYGGTKDQSASRRRFMEDPGCRVFVMNAEAGGTGNDGLQKVAHYMGFFESPPVISRKQTEKRIDRPGQTRRTFFYDWVVRGTVDQGILDDLKDDRDLYDAVIKGSKSDRRRLLLGY